MSYYTIYALPSGFTSMSLVIGVELLHLRISLAVEHWWLHQTRNYFQLPCRLSAPEAVQFTIPLNPHSAEPAAVRFKIRRINPCPLRQGFGSGSSKIQPTPSAMELPMVEPHKICSPTYPWTVRHDHLQSSGRLEFFDRIASSIPNRGQQSF